MNNFVTQPLNRMRHKNRPCKRAGLEKVFQTLHIKCFTLNNTYFKKDKNIKVLNTQQSQ